MLPASMSAVLARTPSDHKEPVTGTPPAALASRYSASVKPDLGVK
jgi:hypothetical protein